MRESEYWEAAVPLLNQRCAPVVNHADVETLRKLRTVFGCIAVPTYPQDCQNFNAVYTNPLPVAQVIQLGADAGVHVQH